MMRSLNHAALLGTLVLTAGSIAQAQCESGWNDAFRSVVFNGSVEGGLLYRGPVHTNLVVYGKFRWGGGGPDRTLAAWNGQEWRALPEEFSTSSTAFYADPTRTPARIIAGRVFDPVGIYEDGRWMWVEPPVSRGSVYSVLTGLGGESDVIYVAGSTYDPDRVSMMLRYDGASWTDLGRGFGRSVTDMAWFDDGSGTKLYATGQPPSYGEPDELRGFARLNDGSWEIVAPERITRPIFLRVHDDGSGPRLFGMNYDILTEWDGQTWTEHELTEYTQISIGSLVSAEVNGRSELIWGGESRSSGLGRVWRWTGTTDEVIGEADGEINAVIADTTGDLGGGVFAVGSFRHINGVSAARVAQWDGATWHPVGTEDQGNGAWASDCVLAVGPDADPHLANRVFAAGVASAGGGNCSGLVAWNGASWECIGNNGWQNFLPLHMLHDEWGGRERVILAGRVGPMYDDTGIGMWDGESWEYIQIPFELKGDFISAFAIGELDGRRVMVVGGDFYDLDTISGGLWVFDGQTWSRFGKGFNETPGSAVFFDDGGGPALYVSGRFTRAGGRPVAQVARWSGTRWEQVGDGLLNNGYPQGTGLQVVDIGEGPQLYVRGWITHSGSTRLYNIARWNGEGWKPVGTNLSSWPPGDLFRLETADGPRLAAIAPRNDGGEFTHRIMVWSGQQWQVLEDGFNASIQSASVSPTNPRAFYLGGNFTRIGETPSEGFAEFIPSSRLCPPDFDCSGALDTRDVVEFARAWAAGEGRADYDGDGQITEWDFVFFLGDWRLGC